MTIRFNQLLAQAGIAPADVRLLRHQPNVAGRSLVDVWRVDRASFEAYQACQPRAKRTLFARDYWASFIGTWDGRTMFAGLYRVGTPVVLAEDTVDSLSGVVDRAGECDRYPLEIADDLLPYSGRLYVDWGGGPSGKRAWVQRADLQDKAITELRADVDEQPFPGLMALTRSLSQLADAPPTWVTRLAEAKGVYLLTCPRDGSHYVGSATAAGGFWARWTQYRANGHGGNVALLGRPRSDYVVSILQVAGSSDTEHDILTMEDQWKVKLLTIDFGLNRNGAGRQRPKASVA